MSPRDPDSTGREQDRESSREDGQARFWKGLEGLWKTSVSQLGDEMKVAFDDVRDAVSRSSRVGRARIDVFLLRREQERLYADLGHRLTKLIREGEIELPEHARGTWERILELEQRLAEDTGLEEEGEAEAGREAEPAADETRPPRRRARPKEAGEKTIGRRRGPARPASARTGGSQRASGRGTKKEGAKGRSRSRTPRTSGPGEGKT